MINFASFSPFLLSNQTTVRNVANCHDGTKKLGKPKQKDCSTRTCLPALTEASLTQLNFSDGRSHSSLSKEAY